MDNQNSLDTTTKKASKKLKIIAGIVIACLVVLAAVLVTINLSVSPAEKTVKAFMKAFKEDNYHAMWQLSGLYAFDDEGGLYSYAGTNIIDYKIKSVSEPHKVKKRWIQKKYNSNEDFERDKETTKIVAENNREKYGIEFVEVKGSDDYYILESLEEVLDEYTVTLDVQYSTISGNTKRNSVTITVCQSDIESDKYEITDILGIIH